MSFEWSNVFNKQKSKSFEQFDEFFAFFERMIEVVLVRMNGFQTASKRNSVRKRKADKAHFCVKGHWPFIPSTLSIQKCSLAVHPFDLLHSKKFISHSSVRPHPFESFNKPFIHLISSVRKFSLAVHPFDLIRSKILISRSSVHVTRFKWLAWPFVTRSLAVPFSVRTATIWNIFA